MAELPDGEREPRRARAIPGLGTLALVLIAGVVLAAIVLGAFAIGRVSSGFGLFDPGRGEYTENTATVIASMRDLATLTTVEVVEYTTVEKGNDRGWLNWATGDRVVMFAVARIGAGVDLEQLDEGDVTVDFATRSITVRVPAGEITYVALDNTETTVFDRDTGLFTRGDPRLESEARQAAETILRDAAIAGGVVDEAERSARQALLRFLQTLGFDDVRIEQG